MSVFLDGVFPSLVVRLASIARGTPTHGGLESLLRAVGGRAVYDAHVLCLSYMGSSQDYGRCQAVLAQRGLRPAQLDWPDGDWAVVDPDSTCWTRQYHPPWLGLDTYEFLTPHTMARAGIRPRRAAALAWAQTVGPTDVVVPLPSSEYGTPDGAPQTIALVPGRLRLQCGDWQTCTDDVLICLGPDGAPVQPGTAPWLSDAPSASLKNLADGYRLALQAALRSQARRVTVVPLDARWCAMPLWLAADVALTQCRQFLAQTRCVMDITLLGTPGG